MGMPVPLARLCVIVDQIRMVAASRGYVHRYGRSFNRFQRIFQEIRRVLHTNGVRVFERERIPGYGLNKLTREFGN